MYAGDFYKLLSLCCVVYAFELSSTEVSTGEGQCSVVQAHSWSVNIGSKALNVANQQNLWGSPEVENILWNIVTVPHRAPLCKVYFFLGIVALYPIQSLLIFSNWHQFILTKLSKYSFDQKKLGPLSCLFFVVVIDVEMSHWPHNAPVFSLLPIERLLFFVTRNGIYLMIIFLFYS